MTVATEYKWLEILNPELHALDEVPQFGHISFPLSQLQESLSQVFDRPDLHLRFQEMGWVKALEAQGGIGQPALSFSLYFSPLRPPLYFLTSEEDVGGLMSELLGGQEAAVPFLSTETRGSFFQFLALELLLEINKLKVARDLSLRLGVKTAVAAHTFFAIDCFFELGTKTFTGRLLISTEFRRAWKEYFAGIASTFSKEKTKKIPMEVALVGGHVQLPLSQWRKAKKGDVIVLDSSSLSMESGKGRLTLEVNNQALFRGKILEEGIKILEYPNVEEVAKLMEDDENLFEDLSQEEFLENEESELPPLPFEEEVEVEEAEVISPVKKELNLEKISIQLTIEVGRLTLPLEELMQLAPGNVIDTKVEPERGVDLVVNGKKVGRGELVKIGDVLGVRILEL